MGHSTIIVVTKYKQRISLGRHGSVCKDNIKKNLKISKI
jgi:hypothetical protein